MYKVRVGNDINIQWRIFRNDSPEDFAGKTLRLLMRGTSQTIEVTDYTIEGNVIKWEFKGKDQRGPSTFTFTLIENEGKDDMFTIDKCDVLRLVSCSCQADDDDGRFDMFIDTDIVLPSNGVDGKTPVLESGETQTLEPGSEATAEVVRNGDDESGNPKYKVNFGIPAGEPFAYDDFTPEQIEGLKKPALDAAAVAGAAADAATKAAANADKAAKEATEAASSANDAAGKASQAAVDAGLAKTAAEEAAAKATDASEAANTAAEEASSAAQTASQTNTEVSKAEQGRVTAEEQRVSAEQTRQTEFSQLKQDAQTATQEANAAAQAANQAAESIEESLSAKQDKTDESLQTSDKTVAGAINEVNAGLKEVVKPYVINLTALLAAQDSESISAAVGGIDNLNGTVQKNQVIFGTLANGTVAVGMRVLGNQTTLTYFVDSVVGLTVNEIIITNTSGTLTKTANTHAVLTENMVVNNLESDETTLPLSAAQGKALSEEVKSTYQKITEGALFAGIADTTTNPPAYDGDVFYIATEPGTYSNFGGIEVESYGVYILESTGRAWSLKEVMQVDSELSAESRNPVENKAISKYLAAGYLFAGMATPTTNPGSPTAKVFYIAGQSGNYVNFGGIVLINQPAILSYGGNSWNVDYIKGQFSNFLIEAKIDNWTGGNDYLMIEGCYRNDPTYNSGIRIVRYDWTTGASLGDVVYFSGVEAGGTANGIKRYTKEMTDGLGTITIVVNWDVIPNQYNKKLDFPIFIPFSAFTESVEFHDAKEEITGLKNKDAILEENIENNRHDIPFRGALPMIMYSSALNVVESKGRTLTPLMLSNFLLDFKVAGSGEAGYTYSFGFQFCKAGEYVYGNYLYLFKYDASNTRSTAGTLQLGKNAPTGKHRYELTINSANSQYITKAEVYLDYDALKPLWDENTMYSNFYLAPTDGYVFDQEYIFDANTGRMAEEDAMREQLLDELAAKIPSVVNQDIKITIPDVVYAVVGTELNLWNDAISLSTDKGLYSPANYQVKWYCTKGLVTNRCFRLTPTDSDVGNVNCTCYLYNMENVLLDSKTFQIKVLAKNAVTATKKIVYFGDSLGQGVAQRLYQNFNDGDKFSGVVPAMLGTRGTTYKYEAVGGYRWSDYATKGRYAYRIQVTGVTNVEVGAKYNLSGYPNYFEIREVNITKGTGNLLIEYQYGLQASDFPASGTLTKTSGGGDETIDFTGGTQEPNNPLWNDETQSLDIALYKQRLGLQPIDKIDAVSFQFGINDSILADDLETLMSYISDLYDAFVEDNPACKFIIGMTTSAGNDQNGSGANYGATQDWLSYLKRTYTIRNFYLTLQNNERYPNIVIAPISLEVDRYYGYAFSERQVSQRYTENEKYHNNYVHPGDSGYGQMADAYMAVYMECLK